MKIGIMGAMLEEIDTICSLMTDVITVERGGRQFHLGKINNHDVVLVFSRWGKVASATTATVLVSEFKITHLIFTGVAGASKSGLNIGDVVISKQLYQHDMDARPLMPRYQIPLTDVTFFQADNVLIQNAKIAFNTLFSFLLNKISKDVLQQFKITQPKCILGTIATGDQFISDAKNIESIMVNQPTTIAVEMEGAAVAQICHDYQIPFVVIRTISDKADNTSAIDFCQFINSVAKYYSQHFIKEIIAVL